MGGQSGRQMSDISRIQEAHKLRGEAWLKKDAEGYLSFYWDDAMIFALGERTNVRDLRRWLLGLLQAGGGPLSMRLPPADDIVLSAQADAATTGYEWQQEFRDAEGDVSDRRYFETNVWYN